MAEWLYEEGIGENRAILVEDGAIVEAAIAEAKVERLPARPTGARRARVRLSEQARVLLLCGADRAGRDGHGQPREIGRAHV